MRINCCAGWRERVLGRERGGGFAWDIELQIPNLGGYKKCIKRWILRIKYFGHSSLFAWQICIYDISAKSRYAYAMWHSVAMASLGLLLSHCDILCGRTTHTHTHTLKLPLRLSSELREFFRLWFPPLLCSALLDVCHSPLCVLIVLLFVAKCQSWDWLEKIGIGIGNERERVHTIYLSSHWWITGKLDSIYIHTHNCYVCVYTAESVYITEAHKVWFNEMSCYLYPR